MKLLTAISLKNLQRRFKNKIRKNICMTVIYKVIGNF